MSMQLKEIWDSINELKMQIELEKSFHDSQYDFKRNNLFMKRALEQSQINDADFINQTKTFNEMIQWYKECKSEFTNINIYNSRSQKSFEDQLNYLTKEVNKIKKSIKNMDKEDKEEKEDKDENLSKGMTYKQLIKKIPPGEWGRPDKDFNFEGYYGIWKVVKLTKLGRKKIRQLVMNGKFPIPSKYEMYIYYPKKEIDEWIKNKALY